MFSLLREAYTALNILTATRNRSPIFVQGPM